ERLVCGVIFNVKVCPLGALITRLLLLMLLTGPINEMPPALNATDGGCVVGVAAAACVAVGVTCVCVVVEAVGVVPVLPVVVPATEEQSVISSIRRRPARQVSTP